MSTLKEEREAVVEEIGQLFADCFVKKARSWGEIKKDIDTAILSHEEKVRKEVEKTDKYREHLFGFHHCNCDLSITNEDNLK